MAGGKPAPHAIGPCPISPCAAAPGAVGSASVCVVASWLTASDAAAVGAAVTPTDWRWAGGADRTGAAGSAALLEGARAYCADCCVGCADCCVGCGEGEGTRTSMVGDGAAADGGVAGVERAEGSAAIEVAVGAAAAVAVGAAVAVVVGAAAAVVVGDGAYESTRCEGAGAAAMDTRLRDGGLATWLGGCWRGVELG